MQVQLRDKLLQPKIIATLVAFLIMTIVVVAVPIGVANNGELDRIMLENGLYSLEDTQDSNYFNYFVKDYGINEYYNDYIDNGNGFSTQKIFISLAVTMDKIFTGNDGTFDIRFFGFLQVLLCSFAIYLFVDYLSYGKKKATGYVIGALVVLVLVDTGYTAFFNSFYANGIEYTSFLIAMTSVFLIKQERYNRYFLTVLYAVCSFVFLFTRTRNAWAGIILSVLSLLLLTPRKDKNFSKDKVFNIVLSSVAVILLTSSVTALVIVPDSIRNIHKYNTMSRGSLKTSQDMEGTLSDFNMYRQYSLLFDTTYYDKFPVAYTGEGEDGEFNKGFYQQFNFVDVIGYYATHPAQFYEMFKHSLENAYTIRPQSTGNYLEESGKEPGSKTFFFSLYSSLKEFAIPRTGGVFYVWLALLYFFYIRSEYNVKIMTAITLIGVSQIFITIFGSGDADMTRNMFMFNVVFDFLNIIMISSWINGYINSFYVKKEKKRKAKIEKMASIKTELEVVQEDLGIEQDNKQGVTNY